MIVPFIIGFSLCFINSAFVIFILLSRIKKLEKFLFIKNDLPAYNIMQESKDNFNEEWDEKKELEKAYRRVVMQDTVDDDDIKKFGIKVI